MTDVIAAEWVKLRTVQSTALCLALALVGSVLGGLLALGMVGAYEGLSPADQATFQGSRMEEVIGLLVAHLVLGVFGALAVTSEYATGLIRVTFVAMPGRRAVLWAKALVVGLSALVIGQVIIWGTYLASRLVVGDRPIEGYADPVGSQVGTLFAFGLTGAVVALVGLGLGVIFRSVVGAIVGVVVLAYVFPILAGNLPGEWQERADAVKLSMLARQVAGSAPEAMLSPGVALAVLLGHAVVVLGIAALVVERRDA